MQVIRINALSLIKAKDDILVLYRTGDNLTIAKFRSEFSGKNELITIKGSNGHLLLAEENEILFSIDNKLILYTGDEPSTVLRAHNGKNFFWHACKVDETTMVQEYGDSPTSIYASSDRIRWKTIVTNSEIDKGSRHFHNIVYDQYRNQLLVTLGDGNYTRAVYSDDEGANWQILCKGAWQFLPIVPLQDKIVFGMDSGLASGGVGIYNPAKNHFEYKFLRWVGQKVRYAQMNDLKRLNNNLWVAALGTPLALLVSEDLEKWYPFFAETYNNQFRHYMKIVEDSDFIICCTGQDLVTIEKKELAEIPSKVQPIMVKRNACTTKMQGAYFILKLKVKNKFRSNPPLRRG